MVRKGEAAPIKVSPECKDLVRYGSALLGLTQSAFVELAVAAYARGHQAELEALAAARETYIDEILEREIPEVDRTTPQA